MDSLIAHLPAGNLDIVDWRRLRTSARELNDLNLADFASVDRLFHRRMIGIESAVETEHHGNSGRPNFFHRLLRFLIIETDWLFAVDSFPHLRGLLKVIDMSIRRRGDQHGFDLLAIKNFSDAPHAPGPSPPRAPFRRLQPSSPPPPPP